MYLGLFFEIIHEPLSLEEGTLAVDDSLQTQAYLVLDRREVAVSQEGKSKDLDESACRSPFCPHALITRWVYQAKNSAWYTMLNL